MAKRQSNDNTPQNVIRLDGEGKVHGNGGKITPACKLRGHGDHTWVTTDESVNCQRCINIESRKAEERNRLEYAANVRDTQDMDFSQREPKNGTPVPRAEFTSEGVKPLPAEAPAYFQTPKSSAIPAVTPVMDSEGEPITVPVDYDNPSAGRRELDASKGERVLSEDTYTVKTRPEDMRRERARDEFMDAFRSEAPATAEAVQALINKLQRLHNGMTGKPESEGFSVTFHEPKNGPALECEIPPIPAGVNPNTWELAHQGNTEGARRFHMRQAEAQEAAYREHMEAMEESRKAVENDTPPF